MLLLLFLFFFRLFVGGWTARSLSPPPSPRASSPMWPASSSVGQGKRATLGRELREYPAQKENARRMTIPPATQAKTSSWVFYAFFKFSPDFRKFHVLFSEMCRKTEFNHHLKDRALRGHVFKAIFVEDEELCRLNCYLENNCISYNFVKNKNFCELSDSDHRQHPEDLQLMNGFIYGASKVKYISTDLLCSLLFKGVSIAKIQLNFHLFHLFCQLFIALGKGILVPESRKIFLVESGIQLKESGIPLKIGIQNPSSTDKDWNPVPGIWNSRPRNQNPRLSSVPLHKTIISFLFEDEMKKK